MTERNSDINFKRLRFWIFVGGSAVVIVLIGIIKNIIIYIKG